jgi:chemotaxis protein CheX
VKDRPVIKVEHINPFITSTLETLEKMAGTEAKPGKPVRRRDCACVHDISGIIGLSGGARGMVALAFPAATAVALANRMIGDSHTGLDAEVADAVGELANIVAGYAKQGLSEFNVTISLPSIILGSGHKIREPRDGLSFGVPFRSTAGDFDLILCLKAPE